MRPVHGVPRIDSAFIGEIRVIMFNYPDVQMEVTIGYLESTEQRRLGSTSKLGGWSPETLSRLAAFLEAVEQDVAKDLFKTTTGSGDQGIAPLPDDIPSL
jgi:hypothetical protein